MTFLQYLSVFRLYSASTLLLALGVTLTTSLLKKTVLKNASKKLFVFLPFLLGILVFCAYRAIVTRSLAPFTDDFCETAEGGLHTGSVATLYYLVYEQFLRKKSTGKVSPFYEMLAGLVPEEKRTEISNELFEKAKSLPEAQRAEYLAQALLNECERTLSPEEVTAYVKMMQSILLTVSE